MGAIRRRAFAPPPRSAPRRARSRCRPRPPNRDPLAPRNAPCRAGPARSSSAAAPTRDSPRQARPPPADCPRASGIAAGGRQGQSCTSQTDGLRSSTYEQLTFRVVAYGILRSQLDG
jgi:hypothetical protein